MLVYEQFSHMTFVFAEPRIWPNIYPHRKKGLVVRLSNVLMDFLCCNNVTKQR